MKSKIEEPIVVDLSDRESYENWYGGPTPTTNEFEFELGRDCEPARRKIPPLIASGFEDSTAGASGGPGPTMVTVRHLAFQPCPPATSSKILGPWLERIAPPDELAVLKSLQFQIAAKDKEMALFSTTRADEKYHGQKFTAEPGQNRSWPEISSDFRISRRKIEIAIEPLSAQAAAAAMLVIERAREVVFDLMRHLEGGERWQAMDYSLPWQPSLLYKASATLLLRWSHYTTLSLKNLRNPKNMLDGIVQLQETK